MKLENRFTVPVPVDQAWQVLLDVERIAPCMPGATLTSVDGDQFEGTVKVKVGPINLTYGGKARFVSKDDAAHVAVIDGSGKETRGTGTAKALITCRLSDEDPVGSSAGEPTARRRALFAPCRGGLRCTGGCGRGRCPAARQAGGAGGGGGGAPSLPAGGRYRESSPITRGRVAVLQAGGARCRRGAGWGCCESGDDAEEDEYVKSMK
jgi:carbon monoxide dehydrogenase subunit G